MIELPEARTIAADLRREVLGKTIQSVSGGVRQPRLHGRGHEMLPGGSGFRSPVPGERAQDHRGQV